MRYRNLLDGWYWAVVYFIRLFLYIYFDVVLFIIRNSSAYTVLSSGVICVCRHVQRDIHLSVSTVRREMCCSSRIFISSIIGLSLDSGL